MSKPINMIGKRFNYLTVIADAGSCNGNKLWLCRCDCGVDRVYKGIRLRHKAPLSCGCDLKREIWKCGGVRVNSGRNPTPLKDKLRYTVDADGCWIWGGHKGEGAYGRVSHNGQYIGAHRASYIVHVGEIPEGLLICHTCDNRHCINPEHLFIGTYSDNTQDMLKKGRGFYQ